MSDNQLVPLERHNQPVAPDRVAALSRLLDRMFDNGWTDFEVTYDLNRTNGVTMKETGEMFALIDVVAAYRKLRDEQTAPNHIVAPTD
jgi:hypothetical protein